MYIQDIKASNMIAEYKTQSLHYILHYRESQSKKYWVSRANITGSMQNMESFIKIEAAKIYFADTVSQLLHTA